MTAGGPGLEIDGRRARAPLGTTIFDAAEAIEVRVPTSCGKQGKCRECLVEIEGGGDLLSAPTPEEDHLPAGFRLSCRARIEREGVVACHTMRRGTLRIVEEHAGLDSGTDCESAPRWSRRGSVLLRDHEPVGEITGPPLGLAVDLGTTAVVLRLEDLEARRRLATHSFENPQRFGGSDVMARIRYDSERPGRLLQRVLLGYLRRAIEELPCDPETIVEMAVVGNSTMRDLFLGLDVHPIGQLPYRSTTQHALANGERSSTAVEIAARKLRLPLHPGARIYALPLVASHVGADAAACLLAVGLAHRREVSMAMDIGTNTEVFIGNRERILAASCPAGPAFEGGGVRCGMPALAGAIERIEIGDDGRLHTVVIGGGRPNGICGSGLVDLLGELRRTGRMNAQGRLTSDRHGGDDIGEEVSEFVVDGDRGLVLTEADINELAQAKGANAAGLGILADRFGIDLEAIDRLYLAGGFGRHLRVAAARRIGLIPDLPDERVVQVGNAALEGAASVLRSSAVRVELETLVRRVEHISLETHPAFFDHFVDGCQFEPFPRD